MRVVVPVGVLKEAKKVAVYTERFKDEIGGWFMGKKDGDVVVVKGFVLMKDLDPRPNVWRPPVIPRWAVGRWHTHRFTSYPSFKDVVLFPDKNVLFGCIVYRKDGECLFTFYSPSKRLVVEVDEESRKMEKMVFTGAYRGKPYTYSCYVCVFTL